MLLHACSPTTAITACPENNKPSYNNSQALTINKRKCHQMRRRHPRQRCRIMSSPEAGLSFCQGAIQLAEGGRVQ